VLGVEVAGGDGCVHWFTDHDFAVVDGAGRRYGNFGSSAKIKHQTGRQADTLKSLTP
jgi:hypothetical protein